jgi:hypothetical protein
VQDITHSRCRQESYQIQQSELRGKMIVHITAIMLFHPLRTKISKAIHIETKPARPMKIDEIMVRDRGGL